MTSNNGVSVVKHSSLLPALHDGRFEKVITPPTDVFETPDAFVLSLDMPGVTKEAINVTMENGTLSIKAMVERSHKENATMLFSELHATKYVRSFNVADNIDRSGIDAHYEHGVLTIKLFKKESARPREIEIT